MLLYTTYKISARVTKCIMKKFSCCIAGRYDVTFISIHIGGGATLLFLRVVH